MPIKSRVRKSTTIETRHALTLTAGELIVFLQDAGQPIGTHARVSVNVPGGGDYSNAKLEIDDTNMIHVEWTTVVREEEPAS